MSRSTRRLVVAAVGVMLLAQGVASAAEAPTLALAGVVGLLIVGLALLAVSMVSSRGRDGTAPTTEGRSPAAKAKAKVGERS